MIIRRKENGKETEREKKKTYHNAFNKMSVFITSWLEVPFYSLDFLFVSDDLDDFL